LHTAPHPPRDFRQGKRPQSGPQPRGTPGNMLTIWIIHRDAHHRAALARIAGVGDSAVLAAPHDRLLESASAPNVVLLGLTDDFEHELQFVHRHAPRHPDSEWILLPSSEDRSEAERLFDTLAPQYVSYPPDATALRRALRDALGRRHVDTLSSRQTREALRTRFSRWFAGQALPELLRSLDPRLAHVPVLIRGEEGTGRGLLAHYLHTFRQDGDEPFVHVACRGVRRTAELLRQMGPLSATGHSGSWTIWLEDVDHLSLPLQRAVQHWIEFGLPEGTARVAKLRWIAGAGDDRDLDAIPGLEPRLAEAVAGLTLHVAPLREHPECVAPFVQQATQAWCHEHGEVPRSFSADALVQLETYPWPGNLHELESLVGRTLSFSSADPLSPVHLRFPGDSVWLEQSGPAGPRSSEVEIETELPEAIILSDDGEEESYEYEPETTPAAAEIERTVDVLAPAESAIEQEPSPDLTEPALEPGFEEPTFAEPAAGETQTALDSNLRRVVRAVAHEIRNPLVSIRTFAELLPEQYDDSEFRTKFRELVGRDVRRIDEALGRLQNMVEMQALRDEPVDVSQLLESLLSGMKNEIQARRLLVLKELEQDRPFAQGDPDQLRDAFEGLLHRALGQVSDRGDIYVASRHHPASSAAGPRLRVLLRHTVASPSTEPVPEADPTPGSAAAGVDLEFVMAEATIQALGGSITLDRSDAQESVIVIDLPGPR